MKDREDLLAHRDTLERALRRMQTKLEAVTNQLHLYYEDELLTSGILTNLVWTISIENVGIKLFNRGKEATSLATKLNLRKNNFTTLDGGKIKITYLCNEKSEQELSILFADLQQSIDFISTNKLRINFNTLLNDKLYLEQKLKQIRLILKEQLDGKFS